MLAFIVPTRDVLEPSLGMRRRAASTCCQNVRQGTVSFYPGRRLGA
jgi:hypothetical protein